MVFVYFSPLHLPCYDGIMEISEGTLDAMMCGDDAPLGASKMLAEVARILRPGGIYMLITYGCPKERVQLLYQAGSHKKIELYIMRKYFSYAIS
jgi:hypothetical protein